MTPDQLIERYIALRAKRTELKKTVDAYSEAMQTIEDAMLELLNEQKVDSFKSREFGTAYRTTRMQATTKDRNELIAHVAGQLTDAIERGEENLVPYFEPFTNAVSKEWVQSYLDQHQSSPPGVEVNHFISVGFRKA